MKHAPRAAPRQMRRRLEQIPLRDIAAPDLPYVTTLGVKLAELYADGDRFRLQEIAGQVSLLGYPFLDAHGHWQNAAGVEQLPLKVWHLVYYCEPKPASRKELRAIEQGRRAGRQPYLLHVLVGQRLEQKSETREADTVMFVGVGFWRSELPVEGPIDPDSHVISLYRGELGAPGDEGEEETKEEHHASTHTNPLLARPGSAGSLPDGQARAES